MFECQEEGYQHGITLHEIRIHLLGNSQLQGIRLRDNVYFGRATIVIFASLFFTIKMDAL